MISLDGVGPFVLMRVLRELVLNHEAAALSADLLNDRIKRFTYAKCDQSTNDLQVLLMLTYVRQEIITPNEELLKTGAS